MQIYADVTGRELKVTAAKQTPALGSAMFGAVAAGKEKGGYDTIFAAAEQMARLKDEVFRPIPANQVVYDQLFSEYLRLHDYFGRGQNNVMKTLKRIKAEALHN
jgi:L-ribulokinase